MSRFKKITNTNSRTLNTTIAYFFDRAEVKKRLNKKEVGAMSKIGAFQRRIMKSLMRPATKPNPHAKPGEPPRTHTKLIRDMIFFSYSPWTHSVVTGPTLVPTNPDVKPIAKTIPELLDEGGFATGKEQMVLRDRQTKRIISMGSRAGAMIMRTKAYKANAGKPGYRYHPIKLPAGIRRFKPHPFRAPTLKRSLTESKLRSAFTLID